MNVNAINGRTAGLWRLGISSALLASGMLLDDHTTAGPTVIADQTPAPPLTTQWQQDQPDPMDVFLPSYENPEAPLPEIFRYGPLQIRPHADYRFLYGDGIENVPGAKSSTVVQEISPGILLDLGRHWALDYTPVIRFYSSHQFRDGVDQNVVFTGAGDLNDWRFGFSHVTQITSAPLVQTGEQTDQTSHTTTFSASHPFNSRISTDLGLSQQITLVDGFQDSYTWSTLDWINYEFWPRLNAGLGVGAGYDKVDPSNSNFVRSGNLDQTYEDLEARVNWRATEKISFQINGGLEDRQFNSAGVGDSLNPIFGASIQYQPFKKTQIALSAARTVSSSDYYLAAQESDNTSVSITLTQGLIRKFSLSAGVGYTWTEYNTAVNGAATAGVNRTDDVVSFSVRLSHPFFKRGTWSVFYQLSDDTSSQSNYSFQSNQTGFEITYTY